MLKITVDWKPQSLVDFIMKVTEVVDANFKDLKRSKTSRGPYRLARSHEHFRMDRNAWVTKTLNERCTFYSRFRRYKMKTAKFVISTDGKSVIRDAEARGKKKGQIKRKLADRTTSMKRQRTV